MNKIEEIKNTKDGLDIKKDIERFAKEGWESIEEDDIHRLKWYGLFLRNPTPGRFMLRVRIPGGHSFTYQIRALAKIAKDFGNGEIDITTRQQFQIRNLKIDDIPEVFEELESAGLSSAQTGMDNVRNIMGCPVAGLHPKEIIDVNPLIRALTQEILENREFTNLPRKFNVLMTGCTDNCLHAETQDLALIPAMKEISGSEGAGFNILVGGKLGSGGYRFATPLDVFITTDEVVEVCSAIILLYRDHGSRGLRSQNRLAFLIDEWGEKRFRAELEKRLGRSLHTSGTDMRDDEKSEHIGIYRQKQPLMNYVGLKVPVGRIDAAVLNQVAGLAEKYGNGEIRISPAQTLIIPHVSDRSLGDLIEEPLLKELVYHPSGIMKGLVSCVGSDYCHLAAIETKSRAKEVVLQLEQTLKETTPINMHWSGCPAGCGNHLVGDIGFLGKRARIGGETVDAVDVFMGGATGKNPKHAIKILENVPCDQLPQVLEGIIPYHTREKMYRKKGAKKSALRKSSTSKSKTGKKTEPSKEKMVISVS